MCDFGTIFRDSVTNNDVLKAVVMLLRPQVELCLYYKLKYIKTL